MKKERYLDANGVAFADYPSGLPASTHDWPKAMILKSPINLELCAGIWNHCQLCGRTPPGSQLNRLHIHHIIHGSRGRSDGLTNLIRLCNDCHDWGHWSNHLSVILWAKWRTERARPTISWISLAMLRRMHLPTPTPDQHWLDEYEKNRGVPAWKVRTR
jgi:hypothetical protein